MNKVPSPIRFYFDFASPYAYCALGEIERIGTETGRAIEWRPILLWAVFKSHGIPAPMDIAVKRDYFLHDMERSAAFFGIPYQEPVKLPLSTHLAARLYYAAHAQNPEQAKPLARRLFTAFFAEHLDISDAAVLTRLAAEADLAPDFAAEAMKGPEGRALLEQAVEEATADKIIGSPFFLVDGEGFFGADRLPQLRWFLSGGGQ